MVTVPPLGFELRSRHKTSQKKPGRIRRIQNRDRIIKSPVITNLKEKYSKYPQWYAVTKLPPKSADPGGYMNLLNRPAECRDYANVLGIKPWVIRHIKAALRRCYWKHPGILQLNYKNHEHRDRLAEEINIGIRNYATTITQELRSGNMSNKVLEKKENEYAAFMALSDCVYKLGSYQVSGYLLYKLAESIMKEMIKEKRENMEKVHMLRKEVSRARDFVRSEKQSLKPVKQEESKNGSSAVGESKKSKIVTLKVSPEKLQALLLKLENPEKKKRARSLAKAKLPGKDMKLVAEDIGAKPPVKPRPKRKKGSKPV
ncbi:hypothetical protein H072_2415 [Dactylellina haptotyla CBS 200.50]|uniref:Uncharacterized protein n=1 Tax=Dactylellina haptotyla (strain CBS 200.50) TaxID=1284197 RepID=S8AKW5_DACHA|nr:hypothetical protein H072_2415 [Dactylellina haptotyla CBS 200.50]